MTEARQAVTARPEVIYEVTTTGLDDACEEAAPLDVFQQPRGMRHLAHVGTTRGRELGQHRAAQEEAAQFAGQFVQHLGGQVVEEVALRGHARARWPWTRRRAAAPS